MARKVGICFFSLVTICEKHSPLSSHCDLHKDLLAAATAYMIHSLLIQRAGVLNLWTLWTRFGLYGPWIICDLLHLYWILCGATKIKQNIPLDKWWNSVPLHSPNSGQKQSKRLLILYLKLENYEHFSEFIWNMFRNSLPLPQKRPLRHVQEVCLPFVLCNILTCLDVLL